MKTTNIFKIARFILIAVLSFFSVLAWNSYRDATKRNNELMDEVSNLQADSLITPTNQSAENTKMCYLLISTQITMQPHSYAIEHDTDYFTDKHEAEHAFAKWNGRTGYIGASTRAELDSEHIRTYCKLIAREVSHE